MVRFGGEISDGVGFCGVFIVCLTVALNRFGRLGGVEECLLARSPSEFGMVTPSECLTGAQKCFNGVVVVCVCIKIAFIASCIN